MSNLKEFRKDGTLTSYALACGCICTKWKDKGIEVYMEHSHFHVKRYARDDKKLYIWEVFDTLGEAYRYASALAKG